MSVVATIAVSYHARASSGKRRASPITIRRICTNVGCNTVATCSCANVRNAAARSSLSRIVSSVARPSSSARRMSVVITARNRSALSVKWPYTVGFDTAASAATWSMLVAA